MAKVWKTLSQKYLQENPFFKVREDKIIYPKGKVGNYWVLERKAFVVSIPLTEKNETFIVGQFRYAPKIYSWELPMGGAEDGESLLECAKRELLEETGITASRWEKIGDFFVAPGYSSQRAEIFIAKNLNFGKNNPTESEEIELKKIKIGDLFKMAKEGKITDGPTIASLFYLENYLNN